MYFLDEQLFLTEDALQLLVVDLQKFHGDHSCWGNAVYIWLDALLCRVPGCAVLVVATHTDEVKGDRGQVTAALRDLEAAINKHMEDKRLEWEHAVKTMGRNEIHGRTAEETPSLTFCG